MSTPIIATKLYIPPPRPKIVLRPRLIERLNEGLHRKLSLVSAPAGFGKTTLVSEWVAGCELPVAWLSLDESDSDPSRFLVYLVAALQTIALRNPRGESKDEGETEKIGEGVLVALQSPQPPSTDVMLTTLLNEIAAVPDHFILVLDDYHLIDAQAVDHALNFLVKHLPAQMHLVIASREDPPLPLARYRARGQLTELRAADLRFTPAEAADFLNQVMVLNLPAEDIDALEARTEGWIAGLQMAALSMQGRADTAGFIQAFTGSHRFVLDYLVEEVLERQSGEVQTFLLRTSILNRMCGSLCDAVLRDAGASGAETLEYLERANLFIVPLDNERYWYRYHRLFRDLLRQRLYQLVAMSNEEGELSEDELHIRASQWYEEHGLALEAFQHAAAANDIERSERLIDVKGMPLHFRGVVNTIIDWLDSLPTTVLDARPSLLVRHATLSLVNGQTTGVEERLQAAEAAIRAAATPGIEPDARTRNLIGQIAAARATLAVTRYQPEDIFVQSRRALEYLPTENLPFRFTALWTLGFAYHLQGDRAAAMRTYAEASAISQASGDTFSTTLALSELGQAQELENQLHAAVETYRRVLQLYGEHPQPNACEAHLGLARIHYEWNELDTAEQHGQQSLQLARQYDRVIDRYIISEVFLARLKLGQGDLSSAAAMIAQTDQTVRRNNFVHRMPEVAVVQVLILLQQGNLAAAAQLAELHQLPTSQARVHLARGNPSAALALLGPLRQEMEAKGWQDERLKVMVLQALALDAQGEAERAVNVLSEALTLAEPGGFIRIFVDEGPSMAQLLSDAAILGIMPNYVNKLLAAFDASPGKREDKLDWLTAQTLIEPLSQRELEVLQLIAEGFSNREISERLFIALDTVKGHNRRIYNKLQVQRRTEAIARARELGLL